MPDRLRYLVGGRISAADINYEINRPDTQYWDLLNLSFEGAINDASGYRPRANGQTGRNMSHWWGYTHSASRPYVYIYKYEANASCSIRLYKFNPYGGTDWSERWYFYNTGPWTDAYFPAPGLDWAPNGQVRMDDRITFLWNWFGWGPSSRLTYKAVYSNIRGNILYWGCDAVGNQRYGEVNPIWSGETLYVYSVENYC